MNLKIESVSKAFPGVQALDDVSLDLAPGEIHALMGENGAGKSTLIKIITGLYKPDAGRVLLDGATVEFNSPRDAIAAGISAVHQERNLIPRFSVGENILLERLPTRNGLVDYDAVNREARRFLDLLDREHRHAGRGAHPVGRPDADRRDRQGAVARGQDPAHGRADGVDHRARDRRPVRLVAAPQGRGGRHRLRQPQARRGLRHCRSRDRAPRRQARRARRGDVGDDPAAAGVADDRPRGTGGQARRTQGRRRTTSSSRRAGWPPRSGTAISPSRSTAARSSACMDWSAPAAASLPARSSGTARSPPASSSSAASRRASATCIEALTRLPHRLYQRRPEAGGLDPHAFGQGEHRHHHLAPACRRPRPDRQPGRAARGRALRPAARYPDAVARRRSSPTFPAATSRRCRSPNGWRPMSRS